MLLKIQFHETIVTKLKIIMLKFSEANTSTTKMVVLVCDSSADPLIALIFQSIRQSINGKIFSNISFIYILK